jgi:hypothetical protein
VWKILKPQPLHTALKRPSHNSKPQQKEALVGVYIVKQAFIFAKYPIMGQALYWGAWLGLLPDMEGVNIFKL